MKKKLKKKIEEKSMGKLEKIVFDEIIYGNVNSNVLTFTIDHLVNVISKDTTIDPNHNRDGGWDNKRECEFLEKLIEMGRFVGEIQLCDIEQCIQNAHDEETLLYFTRFKLKGYKYLSIDGNNRMLTLVKNLNRESLGDYYERFRNILVNVRTFYKIHKKLIPQEFLMINNGLQQSKQVTTNAQYTSQFSVWIQGLSKKMNFLDRFLSKSEMKRKIGDTVSARIFMIVDSYLKDGSIPNLQDDSIKDYYKDYSKGMPSEKSINMTEHVIDILNDLMKNGFSGDGQNFILHPVLILVHMYSGNHLDLDVFWEEYMKAEEKLREKIVHNLPSGETAIQENKYKDWCRTQYKGNLEKRYKALNIILSKNKSKYFYKLEQTSY